MWTFLEVLIILLQGGKIIHQCNAHTDPQAMMCLFDTFVSTSLAKESLIVLLLVELGKKVLFVYVVYVCLHVLVAYM